MACHPISKQKIKVRWCRTNKTKQKMNSESRSDRKRKLQEELADIEKAE